MARTTYRVAREADGYRATIVHHFGAVQSWPARALPEDAVADLQSVHPHVTLTDVGWTGIGR